MRDVAKVGWVTKTLGEVCRLINGRAYQKPELLDNGPYPVLRVGNFFTNNHWYYSDLELSADKYCDDGDLLYAWSASFGPRIWSGGKVIYHYHIWKVVPSAQVDRDFLYYFLEWDKDLIQKELGAGATMIHVSKKSMEARTVPLPPLEEQQRIVAVLDEAFEGLARARAHAEANLQNARELFVASLRSLFSDNRENWPLRNIADVCSEFGRGKSRHRPRNDPHLYGGDMPFVQTGDLSKADHFLREFSQTYSAEGVAQSRVWPKGTVCVAIVGATIGESAILEFNACFPDSIIGMVPDPGKADSEFLEFLLQFVKTDLKEAGKGSARDNINLGTFNDRLFPIPDLKAQLAAIERISEIDKECRELSTEYATKLQDLDDLRQSLLQKAFGGELT